MFINYWKEKESDPVKFLSHFRCTTEPIGGGTEQDDEGELVGWDVALIAVEKAKKQVIDKAVDYISKVTRWACCSDGGGMNVLIFDEKEIEAFKKMLEEEV